jgi:predicted Fe-Mo cluster-binding NifX family protein
MVKVLVTSIAPDPNQPIDPRFGRAAWLLTVDTKTGEWSATSNLASAEPGGAGVQVAQLAASMKVDAVISGAFGPNAFRALEAAGILMYLAGDSTSARQAIERFKAGKLQRVHAATSRGRRR